MQMIILIVNPEQCFNVTLILETLSFLNHETFKFHFTKPKLAVNSHQLTKSNPSSVPDLFQQIQPSPILPSPRAVTRRDEWRVPAAGRCAQCQPDSEMSDQWQGGGTHHRQGWRDHPQHQRGERGQDTHQ